MAVQIRAGTSPIPAFDCLIWVGNSYGAVLGALMARSHPNTFEITILTGYTKRILPSYYGIGLQNPMAAAMLFPSRFEGVHPLYVWISGSKFISIHVPDALSHYERSTD